MNIRFTIEEENIIAIYAEDSRETTLENILAACLLYTSPSPRDRQKSRMPSSA